MKNYKEATDKSAPYRTLGYGMIKAPTKTDCKTKSEKTKSDADLRVKRGK